MAVPPKVEFRCLFDWALPPVKLTVDAEGAREKADLYRAHFRWARRDRAKELCLPWRLAQELGWTVRSPVDVAMAPLEDVELQCAEEDLPLLDRATPYSELWKRGSAYIALPKSPWLRLYDYRADGKWQAMFVPNGDGTLEWHLGWTVRIPDAFFLLVLPAAARGDLDVPVGILAGSANRRFGEVTGFSIAVRPNERCRISRGEPIAKLVLLHRDSIVAEAVHEAVK